MEFSGICGARKKRETEVWKNQIKNWLFSQFFFLFLPEESGENSEMSWDYVYSGLSISTSLSSAPTDLIRDLLNNQAVRRHDYALVSSSWLAEHSVYTKRSKRSCSSSRRRAWPEPPSYSCEFCPGSFHL